MIRPRRVVRLVTAPVLGAIFASAVASGVLAAEPADLAPSSCSSGHTPGTGGSARTMSASRAAGLPGRWSRPLPTRTRRSRLTIPSPPARPGASSSHNAGAKTAGGPSGRVGTLAGTFFWRAYRLPAAGEGCAAFDGGQAGASVTFGYVCRKGELSAAAVATFLDDLDPIGLAAQGVVTASARVDPADDPTGVPGWPFRLTRHQQADER